jgi:chorismate mutase
MACRGVRGATTVKENTLEDIRRGTLDLLAMMILWNDIQLEDVASAIFTTTPDLNAEFPAHAARQLGWIDVPMICGHEMNVPGSVHRCIRILLHWNTDKRADGIHHVYLEHAVALRPDLPPPPITKKELDRWIAEHLVGDGKPGHD